MKLPTVEVRERHYWAVVLVDELDPQGREFPYEYSTKDAAERQMKHIIDQRFATRVGEEKEIPDWY